MNVTEEAGYLIFMEDQNDPSVMGLFWGRLGTIDSLVSIYREQRQGAQFAHFASCTHREYAALLHAVDPLRVGGIWHRRGGEVERLVRAIEAEAAAFEEEELFGNATTAHRSKRHYEYEPATVH